MKIILLSNTSFLLKEIDKIETLDVLIMSSIEELYNQNIENQKCIILHHLDISENYLDILNTLKEDFKSVLFIALRNNPNNIEGCTLLKNGYKAYMHAMSNMYILQEAILTVQNGNTWIYPELMQFLIQSVPVMQKKENQLLDTLTTKELEVLELVAQGLSNAKIAKTLNLAEITVKKHIGVLFKKLQVKDRLSLALVFKNTL